MIIPKKILSTIKENKFTRDNFVNKTKYYYGSDAEDKWEQKLKEGRKSYYINKPIEYKFNNYGYRTYNDFEKGKKGIITLGCSFTEGIGLHFENVWSYKMANHLDKPLYNLAVGGKGIRDSFERLVSFGDYLDYDYVFLLIPPPGRVTIYFGDNDFIKEFYSDKIKKNPFVDFLPYSNITQDLDKWKTILFNGSDYEETFYHFIYLNLIKYYLNSRGKSLIYSSWNLINQSYHRADKNKIECLDIEARDGHWGSKKQHFTYQQFLKKYEELNSNRTS